jgi:hypothetical protein
MLHAPPLPEEAFFSVISQFSCLNFCFIFGRAKILVAAQKLAILNEVFNDLPQSLQANATVLHQSNCNCNLLYP